MRLSLWFALAVALIPVDAWACRCTDRPPRQAYDSADTVAFVKIEEVAVMVGGAMRAKATVVQVWKSALPRSVQILSGDNCVYPLDRGGTYLLYLRRGQPGELGTYRCWGNRAEAAAVSSLQWLATHGRRVEVTAD